jgi:hypothetical protein
VRGGVGSPSFVRSSSSAASGPLHASEARTAAPPPGTKPGAGRQGATTSSTSSHGPPPGFEHSGGAAAVQRGLPVPPGHLPHALPSTPAGPRKGLAGAGGCGVGGPKDAHGLTVDTPGEHCPAALAVSLASVGGAVAGPPISLEPSRSQGALHQEHLGFRRTWPTGHNQVHARGTEDLGPQAEATLPDVLIPLRHTDIDGLGGRMNGGLLADHGLAASRPVPPFTSSGGSCLGDLGVDPPQRPSTFSGEHCYYAGLGRCAGTRCGRLPPTIRSTVLSVKGASYGP